MTSIAVLKIIVTQARGAGMTLPCAWNLITVLVPTAILSLDACILIEFIFSYVFLLSRINFDEK
jgi:hypothetical protein